MHLPIVLPTLLKHNSSEHSKLTAMIICNRGIRYHFTEPKRSPLSECFEILYTFTTTCYKNNVKFQVPHPPGSQIMVFLSFSYFWCIRVSPIQRLSIKLIPTWEFSKDGVPM